MTMAFKVVVGVFGLLYIVTIMRMSFGSNIAMDSVLRFTEEPQNTIALKNHSVLLNCSVVGTSGTKVDIMWHKDGDKIVPDRRRWIMTNGSLYIRRVVHNVRRHLTDEGLYECFASSHVGAIVSRQALLQVAELNHFSGQPQSTLSTEGQSVQFQCQITGFPKPNVQWRKNGQPLPKSIRYLQLSSHSLQMYNLSTGDAGMYSCKAENIASERISKEAELVVNPAGPESAGRRPELLVRPKDQEVIAGEAALLECASTYVGNSQPLIVWSRKDDLPLPSDRIQMLGFRNLEIRNVRESDAGTYRCYILYDPSISSEAILTVLVPPTSTRPSVNIVEPTGRTFRMICDFDGIPQPTVTWMKNGEAVRPNGRIKFKPDPRTLLISNSIANDSGLYQCWAENIAGREGMIWRVYIQPSENAPEPPVGLKVTGVSSRGINVSWAESRAKNGRQIIAYSVHYLPSLGGAELQKVVQNNSAVIEQLQPHTSYTFYVVAYNDKSASQHSEHITQMTSEDVPTAAPEVRVFPAGATTLKVQWEDLPTEKARGDVDRYQIFFRTNGQPSQSVVELDGHINQYNIYGLETDTKYEVRVLAGTDVGFPILPDDQWPWISQITSSTIDIGVTVLKNVQFKVINSTTIHLFWDHPESRGAELLGYKITYQVQGSSEMPRMIILDAVTDHAIHQLQPDTSYDIGICPFTDLGDGDIITKTVGTFPLGVTQAPSAPTWIKAEPLNETSIHVSWSESNYREAAITYYTIRYLPITPEGQRMSANELFIKVNGETLEAIVTDLLPFTVYGLTVQSLTAFSHSSFSREERCQTAEGRPGAPQNVVVYLEAPTDIRVNWQPPATTNGVLVSYVIYYNDDEITPLANWLSQLENGTITTSLISGLKQELFYYIKLQAKTLRGVGVFSDLLQISTRSWPQVKVEDLRAYSDRTIGIIIGICISGVCIIICVIIILLRSRLFPRNRNRNVTHGVNGYAPAVRNDRQLNHHQLLQHNTTAVAANEPEKCVLMLNNSQDSQHLDSKGGSLNNKMSDGKMAAVVKTNGYNIYSKQNGNAGQALLGQHQVITEMSKMSPCILDSEAVDDGTSSGLADDSRHNNDEATTM